MIDGRCIVSGWACQQKAVKGNFINRGTPRFLRSSVILMRPCHQHVNSGGPFGGPVLRGARCEIVMIGERRVKCLRTPPVLPTSLTRQRFQFKRRWKADDNRKSLTLEITPKSLCRGKLHWHQFPTKGDDHSPSCRIQKVVSLQRRFWLVI